MRIVQVMPAPGWTATFIDPDTHLKGDSRPLVCWALMEDGSLAGMVADGQEIRTVHDMRENFTSYHCHSSTHML